MFTSEIFVAKQFIFVQILLISYVGAILGEINREIDDDIDLHLGRFILRVLSSGFGGLLTGLLLHGTIAKENQSLALCGSGFAGFIGQKKAFALISSVLKKLFDNSSSKRGDGA